jgi:hypothetical protein
MAKLTGFTPIAPVAGKLEGFTPTGYAPSFTVEQTEEDKPWYSDAYEVGRQVAGGLAVDLPRMGGQALRWAAPDGSAIDDLGRSITESADARAPGWAPDMQGRGGLASTLIKGGRAVGPMATAIGASMIPGVGAYAGPAVAAAQFGMSSAQDTEDKLRNQGIADDEATAAGWRVGMVQGPLEGAATALGIRAFKPFSGAAGAGMGGVVNKLTDTAVLKPFAKGMGLNMLVQPATEVIQDVGTEHIERAYGAQPEDAWDIAKDSAQGGLGLTMLLGPFAFLAHRGNSQRAQQLKNILEAPDAPIELKQQAWNVVQGEAKKAGINPAEIASWLQEQRMANQPKANLLDTDEARANYGEPYAPVRGMDPAPRTAQTDPNFTGFGNEDPNPYSEDLDPFRERPAAAPSATQPRYIKVQDEKDPTKWHRIPHPTIDGQYIQDDPNPAFPYATLGNPDAAVIAQDSLGMGGVDQQGADALYGDAGQEFEQKALAEMRRRQAEAEAQSAEAKAKEKAEFDAQVAAAKAAREEMTKNAYETVFTADERTPEGEYPTTLDRKVIEQVDILRALREEIGDAEFFKKVDIVREGVQVGGPEALKAAKTAVKEAQKIIADNIKQAEKEKANVAAPTETKQAKAEGPKAAAPAVAPNGTPSVPATTATGSSGTGSAVKQGSVGPVRPDAPVGVPGAVAAPGVGGANVTAAPAANATAAKPAPVVKPGRVVPKGTMPGAAPVVQEAYTPSGIADAPVDPIKAAADAVREKRRKRAANAEALAKGEAIPHPEVDTKLNSGGINSEDLQDYFTLAVEYIRDGARTFAAYSKAMIDEFGEAVKPHLRAIHTQASDELKVKRVDVSVDKHSPDKAPLVSFSSNAKGEDVGLVARMAKGPHAVARFDNGTWVLDPEKSGRPGASAAVLGATREEALQELPYAIARADKEIKDATKATTKSNPSGKVAVKYQPKGTAIIGGRLDTEALAKAMADNQPLHRAVRYYLGIDDDGTRMLDDEQMTQQAAAELAGVGKDSAAAVSDAMKKLGITKYMMQRFMQSSETVNPIEGYVGEQQDDTAVSYIDAMLDVDAEENQNEEYAEQADEVDGVTTSDMDKDELENERTSNDRATIGMGTMSSVGGTASATDGDKNSSIARAKFYSNIKKKGAANVDLHELLTAYTLGARYVIAADSTASAITKRNAAENKVLLDSLSAEIEKRYLADRAGAIQAEQTLRRALVKRGMMQPNTEGEGNEPVKKSARPDRDVSEDGGVEEEGADWDGARDGDEGMDEDTDYAPQYESINPKTEVAPQTPDEFVQSLMALNESIDAKPGANIVRMAKLLGPKLYGSPENLTSVSVKELFQNSFDAIKTLIDNGTISKGKVKLVLDKDTRTIKLIDNGSGMTPKTLANQFLQIAGTLKETDRASGGLGIAKMLFLYGNKHLTVTTARDGKAATLDTSGEELMAALDGGAMPQIDIRDLSSEAEFKTIFPEGHGTAIEITVPETFVDPATGETRDIAFSTALYDYEVLEKSPLFSDIDVEFNGRDLRIGSKFPSDKYTQFANVNFDWGTARIYVTKETSREYSSNTHILSNGLWQFSTKIDDGSGGWNAKAIQRRFYVDIDSKVAPEEAGYPFDLNRQQFSKTTAEDVGKIFRYISALYRNDALSEQAQDFGSVEYLDMNRAGSVQATPSKKLAPDVNKKGSASAAIHEGDTVEVREGRLIVNGRPIPELTRDDLADTAIDLDNIKIDQSEIEPDRVMLHDNLLVDPGSTLSGEALADKLAELREKWLNANPGPKSDLAYAEYTKLRDNEPNKDNMVPISEAARAKFGARFDDYVFGVGDAFRQLRDVVANVMGYDALKTEAVGVSFDQEYRGVSIKIPFSGMFINPAVPEYTDAARAAHGMYGTMIHELAHFKERNHGAGFPAEMQRIMINLAAQDDFDAAAFQRSLVDLVKKHHDVLLWLNERNTNASSTARGRRFKDGSQQTRLGDNAGNMAVNGQTARAAQAIPGRTGQSNTAGQTRSQYASSSASRTASRPVNPAATAVARQYASAADRIRANMSVQAKDSWATVKDFLKSKQPWLLTNPQLVDQFGDKLPPLKDYVGIQQLMTSEATSQTMVFHNIAVKWDALRRSNKHMDKRLNDLMLRATLAEIHPDVEFTDPANKHLPATKRAEYDKLAGQYKAMTPEAKAIYQDAKKALKDSWAERRAAYEKLVSYTFAQRMAESGGDTAKMEQISRDEQDALKAYDIKEVKGPYFPLVRFGSYLAIAESPQLIALKEQVDAATGAERRKLDEQLQKLKKDRMHYRVSAHETVGQRDAAIRQMKADGFADPRTDMTDQYIDGMRAVSQDTMSHITDMINTQFDPDIAADMNRSMTNIFLRSLPEMHALHREAARQGIEGASADMLRAFASTGQQGAFYTSRLMYASELADAMQAMKASAKGKTDLQHIHREMEKRMALDMRRTDTPIQNFVGTLSWISHLGLSPSFAVINATQPWLVTGPVLSGKFGMTKATKALASGSQDAMRILKDARYNKGKWDAWSGISENSLASKEERTMLRELMKRGIVDEGAQNDLTMFANDKQRWFNNVNRHMGWATQQIELVNRTATALASFRLARDNGKGMSYEDAMNYAYDTTVGTQFDYSAVGTARSMREGGGIPLARLIFQFRRYQQGMLYLLVNNFKKMAFAPGERKQAAATLGYFVMASGMAAGALGLPFLGTALALANLFIDDDDPEGDAETRLRNIIYHMTGGDKYLSDILAKGVPAAFGADLSKRIGLGDVASPFPMMRFEGARTGRAKAGEAAINVLGPSGGMAASFFDAMTLFGEGDWYKGVEKLVPKFVMDPMRAARYAKDGMTDGNDTPTGTDIGGWDVFLKSLGIAPTAEANYYEGTAAMKNVVAATSTRKGNIGNRYRTALRSGDMADVRKEIVKFNKDHPENQITPRTEREWRNAARNAVKNRGEKSGVKLGTKTTEPYNKLAAFAQ